MAESSWRPRKEIVQARSFRTALRTSAEEVVDPTPAVIVRSELGAQELERERRPYAGPPKSAPPYLGTPYPVINQEETETLRKSPEEARNERTLPLFDSQDEGKRAFDQAANDSISALSSLRQAPDIMWTIYRDTGAPFKDARTYQSISEKDYDNVQDTASGAAIEMRKHIRVVEPPKNLFGQDPRGNPVLNGDIVDLIESERMIIRSPRLLNELRKVIYWPTGAYYDGQKKLSLDTPYRSIGVYRRELAKLRNEHHSHVQSLEDQSEEDSTADKIEDTKQIVRELDLLLKEVDKVQSANVALEEERHLRQPQAVATFDMLWMLFKPGDYVYVNMNGCEVAARVNLLFWQGTRSIEDPYLTVTVRVWYLDHDGRLLRIFFGTA